MSEEITIYEHEDTFPVVMDDRIIQLAETAERRIQAVNKIKIIALQVTNKNDWIDQNGKPYLQVSGAEKIARLFGISWTINEPKYEIEEDGHFSFIYKGTFSMSGANIDAVGSRSSKDPFFSKRGGESRPVSEIDRNNVRKAAYTNLLGNGITRILGIRNLTWEDVGQGGVSKADATSITYVKDTPEIKEKRGKIKDWLLELCGGEKETAADMLEEMTAFEKDGKTIPGKRKINALTAKQVPHVYNKLKKEYEQFEKALDDGQVDDNEMES